MILAAAALEFAARGFAGARVDRIARRAKVNKAMLYYHFKSKERLYRTLLRRMFTPRRRAPAGDRRRRPAAPADKIDRAIAGIAAFIQEHTFFPAIMLREVAEGGAHLDRETLKALAAVPRTVAGIVEEGVAAGDVPRRSTRSSPTSACWRRSCSTSPATPIRNELAHLHVINMRAMSPAEFVRQAQESARRALEARRRRDR